MGYMRTGSQLRKFIKEKMDTAIEIRDQHITNQNLRETLVNYADKIDRVSSYKYRFNAEDRAQFILRLNEYNSANLLRTERIAANRELIEALGTERPITTEERELFLELLREQYVQIESTIVPVDFGESIKQVTNEQERYAEILLQLETSINDVLSKAETVDLETNPSANE